MDEKKIVVSEEEIDSGKRNLFSRIKTKYKAQKAKKLEKIENEKLSDEESKKVEEKLVEYTNEVKSSS